MASLSPNLAPAWKTRLNLQGFTLGKNRTIPSSIISPAEESLCSPLILILMIVILAANVRILARGFAGTIPQRQAKAQFLIGWLCICVYAGFTRNVLVGQRRRGPLRKV